MYCVAEKAKDSFPKSISVSQQSSTTVDGSKRNSCSINVHSYVEPHIIAYRIKVNTIYHRIMRYSILLYIPGGSGGCE